MTNMVQYQAIIQSYAVTKNLEELVESTKIFLDLVSPPAKPRSFDELLSSSDISDENAEKISTLFRRGDPRVIAVWNCYIATQNFEDAKESITLLP